MYKVNFSSETIKILENFTSINPGILFRPGNMLSTITPGTMSVLARVSVNETFQSEFGLYNLSAFLSILKAFNTPDVEIHDKYLKIVEGNRSSTIGFTSQNLIVFPPEKVVTSNPKDDNSIASFLLPASHLPFLNKISSSSDFNLKDRVLFSDGKQLTLKAVDSSNQESNVNDIILADCDKVFIFKQENLPLIDGDYQVDIFKTNRVARFKGPIEYFVKYEASSTI